MHDPSAERNVGMASEATQLLSAVRAGERAAVDQLFRLVYQELRRLAAGFLRRERGDHTLQTTALVHEAFLRLVDQAPASDRDRGHFLGIAARAMRQILVDHARRRNRLKRGGQYGRVPLDSTLMLVEESMGGIDLEALDDALCRLAQINPRAGQSVELRFFAGLTAPQTAEALGCSVTTVEREWRYARAWLYQQLGGDAASDSATDVP